MELIIKDATFVRFGCFDCGETNLVLQQDFSAGGHYHCSHCQVTVHIDEAQANEARDLLYDGLHGLGKRRTGK